jgi:hypothetical protein
MTSFLLETFDSPVSLCFAYPIHPFYSFTSFLPLIAFSLSNTRRLTQQPDRVVMMDGFCID